MKKTFTLILLTIGMGCAAVMAQTKQRPTLPQRKIYVPAGKNTARTAKTLPTIHKQYAAYGSTLLTEDFSKFTKGTEAQPDSLTNIYEDTGYDIRAEYTTLPGWSGTGVGQAGGCAYLINSFDFIYLQTPSIDLTPNSGTCKLYFKAKSKDRNAKIYVGNAKKDGSDFNIYTTVNPDSEWKEYTAPLINGSTTDVVQFQTQKGVFIDDIRIVVEGVPAPKVLPCTKYTYTSVTANWEPVEGADSYSVHLYLLNTDTYEYNLYKTFDNVQGTSFDITGLDADKTYTYRVTAKRGNEESVESGWAEIQSALGEPVALPATDYAGDSFTANWQAMEGAKAYKLTIYNTEEIDEDFYRYIPKKAYTIDAPATSWHVDGLNADSTYYYTVAAQDEYGVWSYNSDYIKASVNILDTPVALAATDITDKGFTAHWQTVPFATAYKIQLYKTTFATEDNQKMNILNADFSDIMSSGTAENPDMLFRAVPFTDYIDDAYGWNIPSSGLLINGAVGMDNTMSEFFGDSYLISPALNLGHGNVTVNLTCSGNNVTKAVIALVKKEDGDWTTVKSEEVTVGNDMQNASVTLDGGTDNTYIMVKTPDAGYLYIHSLNVSISVKKGDCMEVPFNEKIANGGKTTSAKVSGISIDNNNCYSYSVVATRISGNDAVTSLASNMITVGQTTGIKGTESTAQSSATIVDGTLYINNPDNQAVSVCNVSGAAVAANAASTSSRLSLPAKGLYLVKIGHQTFKLLNK